MQLETIDLTQIIVALIGFMGVMVSVRQKKREKEEDNEKTTRASTTTKKGEKAEPTVMPAQKVKWRTSSVVMLGSMVLFALNLVVFGWRYWGPAPDIEITYPLNNSAVGLQEVVRGTSQRISRKQEIWLVVYPHSVGLYYPQNGPADMQIKGDWASLAIIGVKENTGATFDIIVVLADEAAQDTFNAYLSKSQADGLWKGLDGLPSGAVIYDRVTVTRK
jgi:hypothetical protein